MNAPSLLTLLDTWELDPVVTTAVVVSAVVYGCAAHTPGRPARQRVRWPVQRTAAFLAGLAAVGFALESGLDVYDDQLLSVHMVQHLVLILVAAPLLLAGRPVTLAVRALPPTGRRRLVRFLRGRFVGTLSRPAVGLLAFGITMLATHLTPLYALALVNNNVHEGEHLLYLISGLLFWAVLIPPGPVARRLDGLGQVVYLLLGMPFMSVVGVIFETGSTPRYHQYVTAARGFGISALSDQRLAGTLMWLAGTLAMGALALTLAWRAMVSEEHAMRRREAYAEHPVEHTAATNVVTGKPG